MDEFTRNPFILGMIALGIVIGTAVVTVSTGSEWVKKLFPAKKADPKPAGNDDTQMNMMMQMLQMQTQQQMMQQMENLQERLTESTRLLAETQDEMLQLKASRVPIAPPPDSSRPPLPYTDIVDNVNEEDKS